MWVCAVSRSAVFGHALRDKNIHFGNQSKASLALACCGRTIQCWYASVRCPFASLPSFTTTQFAATTNSSTHHAILRSSDKFSIVDLFHLASPYVMRPILTLSFESRRFGKIGLAPNRFGFSMHQMWNLFASDHCRRSGLSHSTFQRRSNQCDFSIAVGLNGDFPQIFRSSKNYRHTHPGSN